MAWITDQLIANPRVVEERLRRLARTTVTTVRLRKIILETSTKFLNSLKALWKWKVCIPGIAKVTVRKKLVRDFVKVASPVPKTLHRCFVTEGTEFM